MLQLTSPILEQSTLDQGDEMLTGALLGRIDQVKQGATVVHVDDQTGWLGFICIHEQHHHLAVTRLCTMIRAGAIRMAEPRRLQVKSRHNLQASVGQLLDSPVDQVIAGFI